MIKEDTWYAVEIALLVGVNTPFLFNSFRMWRYVRADLL